MEENWQAELNNTINDGDTRWNRGFSRGRFAKINILVAALLFVLVIPAVVSGIYDQRSRAASSVVDTNLKMNLNIPICSSPVHKSCGYQPTCSPSEEGKTCEHLFACENGSSSNDVFLCRQGVWVQTTRLKSGYCNLCVRQEVPVVSQAAQSASSQLFLSPTIFQGPTIDPYLHRNK